MVWEDRHKRFLSTAPYDACIIVGPPTYSDWHLGYPDCAGAMQSPINLADDVVETAEASFGSVFGEQG